LTGYPLSTEYGEPDWFRSIAVTLVRLFFACGKEAVSHKNLPANNRESVVPLQ
jgi:hypothetical protein